MRVQRALVCSPRIPEYDREGGSRRTFHLLEFLLEAGWAVTLIAHDATAPQRYARVLRQQGVAVYAGPDTQRAGDDYLPDPAPVVSAGRFDLAILTFWNVGEAYLPSLRSLSPRTRVIVDSIDLHFLRMARGIFRDASLHDSLALLDEGYGSQFRREINVYAAADAVLAVSQKEANLINDIVGVPDHAVSVPLMEDLPVSEIPFEQRQGILFIGNYRHPPNREAVEYLVREILPLVSPHVLARHPLYLVGNDLDKLVTDLGSLPPNVRMIGWVPSLVPYLQRSCITVAPILTGAGTKTKLIQSLTVGTPAVSTAVGVEGLELEDGKNVLIANDASSFAHAITRLVSDKDLWQAFALEGRSWMTARHGRDAVRQRLETVIRSHLAEGN